MTPNLQDTVAALRVIPRLDHMTTLCLAWTHRASMDESMAPIWSEKLRYVYTTLLETKYPDLPVAAGEMLPIDTSPSPADETYIYKMIDVVGYADWISDDGEIAPNSAITSKSFTGRMDNIGHEWDCTIFDLERCAKAGLPLEQTKAKASRRFHDAKTQWVWLFGDADKDIPGIINHPNIPITLAALNGGATSRRWANKTADEIAADVAVLINAVSNNTKGNYFAATIYMSRVMMQRLRDLRLGAGDGFASIYDLLKDRYKGDDTGQGKVTFKMLREAAADERTNPVPVNGVQSDTSGIAGDFAFAIAGGLTKDDAAFIRSRPFTQVPPQEEAFKIRNLSHSKIGGAKVTQPLAFHRLDFGVT